MQNVPATLSSPPLFPRSLRRVEKRNATRDGRRIVLIKIITLKQQVCHSLEDATTKQPLRCCASSRHLFCEAAVSWQGVLCFAPRLLPGWIGVWHSKATCFPFSQLLNNWNSSSFIFLFFFLVRAAWEVVYLHKSSRGNRKNWKDWESANTASGASPAGCSVLIGWEEQVNASIPLPSRGASQQNFEILAFQRITFLRKTSLSLWHALRVARLAVFPANWRAACDTNHNLE